MANEQVSERGAKAAAESNKGKAQTSSGGRSEQNAQQRNNEQAQAPDDGRGEEIRPPEHNVRSEPHWDPTEPPTGGNTKGAGK